jgi:hypothetical protein
MPTMPTDEPAGQMETRILGANVLKSIILVGVVLAFAALYLGFALDVLRAPTDQEATIDPTLANVAGGLAGILGTGFALALGVKKTEGSHTNKIFKADRTPDALKNAFKGISLAVTFGVWAYPIVAAIVGVVVLTHLSESPPVLTTLVSVAGGYVITFATAAFHSIRS